MGKQMHFDILCRPHASRCEPLWEELETFDAGCEDSDAGLEL